MLFSSGMNPHSLARFLQEIKYHTFDLERLAYFRSFLRDGQAAGAGAGAGAGGGGNSGKQGKKKKKKKGGGRGGGKKAFGGRAAAGDGRGRAFAGCACRAAWGACAACASGARACDGWHGIRSGRRICRGRCGHGQAADGGA